MLSGKHFASSESTARDRQVQVVMWAPSRSKCLRELEALPAEGGGPVPVYLFSRKGLITSPPPVETTPVEQSRTCSLTRSLPPPGSVTSWIGAGMGWGVEE